MITKDEIANELEDVITLAYAQGSGENVSSESVNNARDEFVNWIANKANPLMPCPAGTRAVYAKAGTKCMTGCGNDRTTRDFICSDYEWILFRKINETEAEFIARWNNRS